MYARRCNPRATIKQLRPTKKVLAMPTRGGRCAWPLARHPYPSIAFIAEEDGIEVFASEEPGAIVGNAHVHRVARFAAGVDQATTIFTTFCRRGIDLDHLTSLTIDNLFVPLKPTPHLQQLLLDSGYPLEHLQLTNCTATCDWLDLLSNCAFRFLDVLNLAGSDYQVADLAAALVEREGSCNCRFLRKLVLTEDDRLDCRGEDWEVFTERGEEWDPLLLAYTQIYHMLPDGFEMVSDSEVVRAADVLDSRESDDAKELVDGDGPVDREYRL